MHERITHCMNPSPTGGGAGQTFRGALGAAGPGTPPGPAPRPAPPLGPLPRPCPLPLPGRCTAPSAPPTTTPTTPSIAAPPPATTAPPAVAAGVFLAGPIGPAFLPLGATTSKSSGSTPPSLPLLLLPSSAPLALDSSSPSLLDDEGSLSEAEAEAEAEGVLPRPGGWEAERPPRFLEVTARPATSRHGCCAKYCCIHFVRICHGGMEAMVHGMDAMTQRPCPR